MHHFTNFFELFRKHIIDLTVQQNKPKKKCADQFWIICIIISDKHVLRELTDDIIVNAAQALLKKHFSDIQRLQRPSL